MRKLTKALVLATAMAMPVAAVAEGHTSEYAGSKGYVGEKGYVAETAQPRQVTHQAYHGNKYSNRRVVAAADRWQVPGCPHGFNGMYRGTLYCIDGRPIH